MNIFFLILKLCFADRSGFYLKQLKNIFYDNVIKDILLYLKIE